MTPRRKHSLNRKESTPSTDRKRKLHTCPGLPQESNVTPYTRMLRNSHNGRNSRSSEPVSKKRKTAIDMGLEKDCPRYRMIKLSSGETGNKRLLQGSTVQHTTEANLETKLSSVTRDLLTESTDLHTPKFQTTHTVTNTRSTDPAKSRGRPKEYFPTDSKIHSKGITRTRRREHLRRAESQSVPETRSKHYSCLSEEDQTTKQIPKGCPTADANSSRNHSKGQARKSLNFGDRSENSKRDQVTRRVRGLRQGSRGGNETSPVTHTNSDTAKHINRNDIMNVKKSGRQYMKVSPTITCKQTRCKNCPRPELCRYSGNSDTDHTYCVEKPQGKGNSGANNCDVSELDVIVEPQNMQSNKSVRKDGVPKEASLQGADAVGRGCPSLPPVVDRSHSFVCKWQDSQNSGRTCSENESTSTNNERPALYETSTRTRRGSHKQDGRVKKAQSTGTVCLGTGRQAINSCNDQTADGDQSSCDDKQPFALSVTVNITEQCAELYEISDRQTRKTSRMSCATSYQNHAPRLTRSVTKSGHSPKHSNGLESRRRKRNGGQTPDKPNSAATDKICEQLLMVSVGEKCPQNRSNDEVGGSNVIPLVTRIAGYTELHTERITENKHLTRSPLTCSLATEIKAPTQTEFGAENRYRTRSTHVSSLSTTTKAYTQIETDVENSHQTRSAHVKSPINGATAPPQTEGETENPPQTRMVHFSSLTSEVTAPPQAERETENQLQTRMAHFRSLTNEVTAPPQTEGETENPTQTRMVHFSSLTNEVTAPPQAERETENQLQTRMAHFRSLTSEVTAPPQTEGETENPPQTRTLHFSSLITMTKAETQVEAETENSHQVESTHISLPINRTKTESKRRYKIKHLKPASPVSFLSAPTDSDDVPCTTTCATQKKAASSNEDCAIAQNIGQAGKTIGDANLIAKSFEYKKTTSTLSINPCKHVLGSSIEMRDICSQNDSYNNPIEAAKNTVSMNYSNEEISGKTTTETITAENKITPVAIEKSRESDACSTNVKVKTYVSLESHRSNLSRLDTEDRLETLKSPQCVLTITDDAIGDADSEVFPNSITQSHSGFARAPYKKLPRTHPTTHLINEQTETNAEKHGFATDSPEKKSSRASCDSDSVDPSNDDNSCLASSAEALDTFSDDPDNHMSPEPACKLINKAPTAQNSNCNAKGIETLSDSNARRAEGLTDTRHVEDTSAHIRSPCQESTSETQTPKRSSRLKRKTVTATPKRYDDFYTPRRRRKSSPKRVAMECTQPLPHDISLPAMKENTCKQSPANENVSKSPSKTLPSTDLKKSDGITKDVVKTSDREAENTAVEDDIVGTKLKIPPNSRKELLFVERKLDVVPGVCQMIAEASEAQSSVNQRNVLPKVTVKKRDKLKLKKINPKDVKRSRESNDLTDVFVMQTRDTTKSPHLWEGRKEGTTKRLAGESSCGGETNTAESATEGQAQTSAKSTPLKLRFHRTSQGLAIVSSYVASAQDKDREMSPRSTLTDEELSSKQKSRKKSKKPVKVLSKPILNIEDVMKNEALAEHAFTLWKSEKKWEIQQAHQDKPISQMESIQRANWVMLVKEERQRYFLRALAALTDENKHSPERIIDKLPAALTKQCPKIEEDMGNTTHTQTGVTDRKLQAFRQMSVSKQHKLLRQNFSYIQRMLSNEYTSFITSIKTTLRNQRLGGDLENTGDLDQESRDVMFREVLRRRDALKEAHLVERIQAGASFRRQFKEFVTHIIAGHEVVFDPCVKCPKLRQTLVDLQDLERKAKVSVRGDLRRSDSFVNLVRDIEDAAGYWQQNSRDADMPEAANSCRVLESCSHEVLSNLPALDESNSFAEKLLLEHTENELPPLTPSCLEECLKADNLKVSQEERPPTSRPTLLEEAYSAVQSMTNGVPCCELSSPSCVLSTLLVLEKFPT